MHIPDGFLDTKTWVALDLFSTGWLGWTINRIQQRIKEESIPIMGVIAAFIFAAQMVNFPVLGGTSGHLLGAVLALILLGPLSATIVMAAILMIQSLIFQDGGLLALGANIFNMGIVGVWVGYGIYKVFTYLIKGDRGILIGAFIAAWISVVAAATSCAIMLAVSGTVPIQISLPAMAGIHALIGIGEGLITCFVLSFILKVRPDLLAKEKI